MRYPSIEQLLAAISFTQSDLSLFSFLHLDIDSLRGIQILEIAMLIFVGKTCRLMLLAKMARADSGLNETRVEPGKKIPGRQDAWQSLTLR